jgi:hypothetical protein
MPRPNLKSFYRLLRYPPNLIVMISGAFLFAAFYSILITFPRALGDSYGFSEAEVGYAYLASGNLGKGSYSFCPQEMVLTLALPRGSGSVRFVSWRSDV